MRRNKDWWKDYIIIWLVALVATIIYNEVTGANDDVSELLVYIALGFALYNRR